ncbi:MAG: hypothetical protein IPO35_02170 [Uliginosibacterium sp.]|nr:hypothetical protein [Uliginosibacterium sp.]
MIRRPLRMVWLCAALTGLAPPAFAQPLSLDEAQRIAERRAPLLAAARAQEAAAREMAVAAGQLPDENGRAGGGAQAARP